MGDLATSKKNSQSTSNQQVGVNGTGASGASGTIGKGAAQAVSGGISLVFNTGGNKISSKDTVGNASTGKNKPVKGKTTAPADASPPAPAGSSGGANSASNQAGGNIAVSIQQTDQGAVQAGTDVSLAALEVAKQANDALLQSNTNSATLASLALQAGADVAAVAIPTYAAQEIAGNAINPQPVTESVTPSSNTNKILIGLFVIGLVVSVGFALKHKP
ncbi:MAG TPA: hypothetical protein VHC44_18765 [Verrucomicrobiae bacterium]|nr:hypothetical protein [Verrucomicrobiae bacterium]